MTVQDLPTLNASLNAVATVLITAGFIFIKKGNMKAHRRCMLSAAAASALFLTSYLTYHALKHGRPTPIGATGWIRTLYYTILWTHIPLAGAIAFLVPKTFSFAIKGDFVRHKAWARITFPIWFYVSVTGVLVYFFLYQWWPARA